MTDENVRRHNYHAEARALTGYLRRPIEQELEDQAAAKLPEEGGYVVRHARDFHAEQVITFKSAYSQLSGASATPPCEGAVTTATSVVEGLNILDVVTADRIVARVATTYPAHGHVPAVSFLGTRFENLRVAGRLLDLNLDLNVLGSKPENDAAYTTDRSLAARIAAQYERLKRHLQLPSEQVERYNQLSSTSEGRGTLECSLVNDMGLTEPLEGAFSSSSSSAFTGSFPGEAHGHVIRIPEFGVLSLGEVRVMHAEFDAATSVPRLTTVMLTMLDLKLQCTGQGHVQVCMMITNGGPKPNNPPPPLPPTH